jgi:uncharacterized protein
VKITFDPNKSRKNAEERDLPFERVVGFDWETAQVNVDDRFVYAEPRFAALFRQAFAFSLFYANS